MWSAPAGLVCREEHIERVVTLFIAQHCGVCIFSAVNPTDVRLEMDRPWAEADKDFEIRCIVGTQSAIS